MTEKEEQLLKTLIYEEYSRKKLASSGAMTSRWRKYVPVGIAASVGLMIYAASVIGFSDDNLSRAELVSEHYSFPNFDASRSKPARIDLFKEELDQKKYAQVLDSLRAKSTDDRDILAQGHLLFVLDSLDQVESFVRNNPVDNDQFASEMEWLSFLTAYKKDAPKSELESTLDNLPDRYLDAAESLIKALDQ